MKKENEIKFTIYNNENLGGRSKYETRGNM